MFLQDQSILSKKETPSNSNNLPCRRLSSKHKHEQNYSGHTLEHKKFDDDKLLHYFKTHYKKIYNVRAENLDFAFLHQNKNKEHFVIFGTP